MATRDLVRSPAVDAAVVSIVVHAVALSIDTDGISDASNPSNAACGRLETRKFLETCTLGRNFLLRCGYRAVERSQRCRRLPAARLHPRHSTVQSARNAVPPGSACPSSRVGGDLRQVVVWQALHIVSGCSRRTRASPATTSIDCT